VRLADFAALEQREEALRALLLAALAADGVDARVEGRRRAEQGLERHGAGDVRSLPEAARLGHGERGDGAVRLRAVDQREAFLRPERDGREAMRGEHGLGLAAAAGMVEHALADDGQREV